MAHMESAHAEGTCGCVDYVEKCICDDPPYPGESHDLKCCLQEQRRMAFLRKEQRAEDARYQLLEDLTGQIYRAQSGMNRYLWQVIKGRGDKLHIETLGGKHYRWWVDRRYFLQKMAERVEINANAR